MIRHCLLPDPLMYQRAICLNCGIASNWNIKPAMQCACLGKVILVESENTPEGMIEVDMEVDRLTATEQTRLTLLRDMFPNHSRIILG